MIIINQLPIDLQCYILKYIGYSPTSDVIKANLSYIKKKQLYYNYIDNRFDIFNTNDTIVNDRLFTHNIMRYIHLLNINHSITYTTQKQLYYKEKLKKLLIIYNGVVPSISDTVGL